MPSVHIIVDGHPYTVGANQSMLQACLSLGFDLPYFCWHPAMGSVGACRQCAVKQLKDEHDEHGRLVMSCMTPVSEGLRISIEHPEAVAFRSSVIEGMMVHHPHDCPVCDEGGHCQLQDMTVMTGHSYRRYRFQKRTFRNQYLGPFVHHEMNRCIQCYRCVRFYREYAGGRDFDALGISDRVFFGREQDGVLASEFAGNLVEVCPTGVFTDATLKHHYTRKWDLRWTPSVCAHCSLGCNISPGERYNSVRTTFNRYNSEINGYFLCDRGRYAYEYLASDQRIRQAVVRGVPTTAEAGLNHLRDLVAAQAARWGEADQREAAGRSPDKSGASRPGRMIGIGSPRASLESNFALRELVGRDRFFAGMRDNELALINRILDLMRSGLAHVPSLRDIENCDAALVLGEDLTNSAARMALSLRQAMRKKPLREICDPLKIPHWLDHAAREAIQDAHGPLFQLTPAATKLDDISTACHHAAPDDLARLALDFNGPIFAALLAADRPLIIAGTSCGSPALIEAAAAVAAELVKRGRKPELSFVVPEANSLGLALLNPRPLGEGLDLARFDDIETVIVLETDLERRAPAAAVEAFLTRFRVPPLDEVGNPRRHLVVLDQVTHSTAQAAELVLPAASWAEGDGTFISNEGRAQRFFQVLSPNPEIRESWRWLEQAQDHDVELDGLLASLAASEPALAKVRDAAPAASFRLAEQKMPRETHRFSGRTAKDADISVSEPKPPVDEDTALSFTMEGYNAQPPAALTAFFWRPGWNSPQSQLGYQSEVNQSIRGGDAGVRLFDGAPCVARSAKQGPISSPLPQTPGSFLTLRSHHLFGSDELSRLGKAIAELSPAAYVGVSAEAATAAGWRDGQPMRIELDSRAYQVPLRIVPGLAASLATVPAGFTAFDGAALPAWTKIEPAEAAR
ncbi:MAG: NADH-quinone oxidoreductase subunit NuoG [Acidobacteria bacterium]|nr:MAG: NADH-quinone oxidoreductase subunit NuoG [Acidobacteriota bacterium]